MSRFVDRLVVGARWRREAALQWLHGRAARIGPRFHVHLRWPWPIRKPWQRKRLSLYPIEGGVGDELMCLPILAEIKRRNPACEITFYCRNLELFEGNPHVDCLKKLERDRMPAGYGLIYRNTKPPPRPLMTLMAECVGLPRVEVVFPRPALTGVSEGVREAIEGIRRPFVVIQPRSGKWTPNKQWPIDRWREVTSQLLDEFDVVEVGGESILSESPGAGFHGLAGRTSLMDVSYVMSRAAAFAGLPSSGMHFAAMWCLPSVVIFSGYESPSGYEYPFFRVFHDPPECAPCWLTTPCPHDLKCLEGIKAAEVTAAVREAVNREK